MSEKPILFSAPMVRAILDGRKTQTRRICKVQAEGEAALVNGPPGTCQVSCDGATGPIHASPYGAPGDRLWVRETWAPADYLNGSEREEPQQIAYRATSTILDHGNTDPARFPLDTYAIDFDKITWHPSIFMPRWASRITLEVTGVRVERLQSISEEDATAEGISKRFIPRAFGGDFRYGAPGELCTNAYGDHSHGEERHATAREAFSTLWDSINGKRGDWASSPWVWVVSFRRSSSPGGRG